MKRKNSRDPRLASRSGVGEFQHSPNTKDLGYGSLCRYFHYKLRSNYNDYQARNVRNVVLTASDKVLMVSCCRLLLRWWTAGKQTGFNIRSWRICSLQENITTLSPFNAQFLPQVNMTHNQDQELLARELGHSLNDTRYNHDIGKRIPANHP